MKRLKLDQFQLLKTIINFIQLKYIFNNNTQLMGNCQQPFENVKDNYSQISEYIRYDNTKITYRHQSLKRKHIFDHPTRNDTPLDDQFIHSTVLHRDVDLVKIEHFNQEEIRPQLDVPLTQLEQLDYDFYHQLALSDYVFKEIPSELIGNYVNLQTVEQTDQYGVKYVGQWKNNNLHGNGVLISNTSKYIGQFRNGLKHLHGRQIFKFQVYQGYFQNGRRKGNGIRYTKELTEIGIFDGQMIYGQIEYLNGDNYKGSLQNHKYYGKGFDFSKLQSQSDIQKLTESEQEQFHKLFQDDYLKLHLKIYLQQNSDDGMKNRLYEALNDIHYEHTEFKEGEIVMARVKYANGNVYEGQLNNKKKHGYGKYTWKDGTVYQGEYQWDQKDGKGTIITHDNKHYQNKTFANGQIVSVQSSIIRNDYQQSQLPSEWK